MTKHPMPLVETGWLAEHLDDPAVRVLDCTWAMPTSGRDTRAEYLARHIPGAGFFDIDVIADTESSLPHMLPAPDRFAAAVGWMGVGNHHHVVVYDTSGLVSAPRVWWMFRVFGHDRVAVLDGGLPKWLAEGRPVSALPEGRLPERFHAGFRPELVRSLGQIREIVGSGAEQILDVRSAGRFDGSEEEPWPGRRRGHIPGSRNLPFGAVFDPKDRTMVPPGRIARLVAEAGIAPGRPVVTTCGSGVTACILALALHRLGRDDVAVYDGSWAEWGLRDDLPAATGAGET